MRRKKGGDKFLLILTFAGLCVAVLALFEGRLEWISSFCRLFGDGCREAENFNLLRTPVPAWGIGYFAVLFLVICLARPWVFWVVMMGFGIELSFLWAMFSLKVVCVFCLFNAVIMIMLFFLSLDGNRVWQTLAVCLLFFVSSNFLLFRENKHKGAIITGNGDTSIVARVAGEVITSDQIERPLLTHIYDLKMELYGLKRNQLNKRVDEILLEKEAEKKGLSRQELIDSILSANTKVTDEEAENFYQQNRHQWDGWKGSREGLRDRIKKYLKEEKNRKKIKEYIRGLRRQYKVAEFLKEPPLPLTTVNVGKSPVSGPPDAPVTIVLFSDYQCSACREGHEISKEINAIYGEKIRWVFKDFSFETHNGSRELIVAARCAGEQGRFREFRDMLFESEGISDIQQLNEYALLLDLDMERFSRCFKDEKLRAGIDKEIKDAADAGIDVTPTFIINGRLRPGVPGFEELKRIIDEELKKSALISGK